MADDPKPRPFIMQWRSAVLNSRQSSTVKLCLLTLAEFADHDGSNCYPSIPRVAAAASVNEKTVRRSFDQAESAGFIERTYRTGRGATSGWRHYEYRPLIPEGADSLPVRSIGVADTQSGTSEGTCGLSVSNVRTLCPEGPGTESTDLSTTYPLPREEKREAPASAASRPADPIWGAGLDLLKSKGASEKEARPVLGKCRQVHGEAGTIILLAQIERDDISSPVDWLWAHLKGKGRSAPPGRLPRDTRSEDELMAAFEADARRRGMLV